MAVSDLDITFLKSVVSSSVRRLYDFGEVEQFWRGLSEVLDDIYIQLRQVYNSARIDYTPIWWHSLWYKFDFDDGRECVSTLHRHYHEYGNATLNQYQFSATGTLDDSYFWFNGALQNLDYDEGNQIFNTGSASAVTDYYSHDTFTNTTIAHDHEKYEELVTGAKNSFTISPAAIVGDDNRPTFVYVNGVKLNVNEYTQPNSTTVQTTTALTADDWITIWYSSTATGTTHGHYRISETLSLTEIQSGYVYETDKVYGYDCNIWLNGILLHSNEYGLLQEGVALRGIIEDSDVIVIDCEKPVRQWRYTVDSAIKNIPSITLSITDPTTDAIVPTLETPYLYVDSNLDDFRYWAPDIYYDDSTIYNVFGDPVDYLAESTRKEYAAIRGIWYGLWYGPMIEKIRKTILTIIGCPLAPVTGRIALIDGNDMIFEDGTKVTKAPNADWLHGIGQNVTENDELCSGVTIRENDWAPHLANLPDMFYLFSEDGNPYSGFFDTGGTFDDGWNFDSYWEDNISNYMSMSDILAGYLQFVFGVEIELKLLGAHTTTINNILSQLTPSASRAIVYGKESVDETLPGVDETWLITIT